MLSIAPLTRGPSYYLELTALNYYSAGGEPLPVWAGTLAKEFSLSGVAEKEHVYRLCAGFDHLSGTDKLVQNAGKEKRNPGHDLTFSSPKTVSLAWALGDDEMRKAIEKAQLTAVKQALAYVEDKAGFARVGKDGQEIVRCPMLFASFEHSTSRALDPQLHTHALLINLTMHADGRTTALDSTYVYHFKMAAGAIYRAALAEGMQKLGFDITQRQLGASIGFEVSGIPEELVEEFSKRRAEIEEQLKLRAGSLDAASAKYAELVAKETRRTKETEKPRAELLKEWQEIGKAYGVDVSFLQAMLTPHRPITPQERIDRKQAIFDEALSALGEQHAHWNEADLTKAVAERAAGRISARDVRELVENKLHSLELVPLGNLKTERKNQEFKRYVDREEMRFTTPEIRSLESRMLLDIERIRRSRWNETPLHFVEAALLASSKRGITLAPEQENAVRYLTSGPAVRLLVGIAGTGKTTTLATCLDAWRREDPNRLILGTAVAAKIKNRLQEELGEQIQCETLKKALWLLDTGRLTLDSKSVIMVDESGTVGTRMVAKLVEHIKKAPGSRLVLVGDAMQLQPVEAGGPFKYLESLLGEPAKLVTIRRQVEQWAREAVSDFERGDAGKAISSFLEHGLFQLGDTRKEAMGKLFEQWRAEGGAKDPNRLLVLASLNAEVKELNLLAQAERIRVGQVDAERKLFANGVFFHVNDRLEFLKPSTVHGFVNGDGGTVIGIDAERQRISVRLDKGEREITVDLKRFSGSNLRLGYATTTHKAQGATVEVCLVLMGGPLTDLHMGYVQISRGKVATHLFCDKHTAGEPNLADLIRSLGQVRQKTMSQEVIDSNRPRQRERGISLEM